MAASRSGDAVTPATGLVGVAFLFRCEFRQTPDLCRVELSSSDAARSMLTS